MSVKKCDKTHVLCLCSLHKKHVIYAHTVEDFQNRIILAGAKKIHRNLHRVYFTEQICSDEKIVYIQYIYNITEYMYIYTVKTLARATAFSVCFV